MFTHHAIILPVITGSIAHHAPSCRCHCYRLVDCITLYPEYLSHQSNVLPKKTPICKQKGDMSVISSYFYDIDLSVVNLQGMLYKICSLSKKERDSSSRIKTGPTNPPPVKWNVQKEWLQTYKIQNHDNGSINGILQNTERCAVCLQMSPLWQKFPQATAYDGRWSICVRV